MIENKLKILIIDNAFNNKFEIGLKISWRIYYFLQFYKRLKLKQLIKKLQKEYKKEVILKVISNNVKEFNNYKNVNIELLSNFRLELDREIYLEIKNKIKKITKENLKILLNNLEKLKTLLIENLSIGESLEYHLIWFFNEIFGESELIKKLVQEKYDKFIIINHNPNFEEFFKFFIKNHQKIEICRDSFLKRIVNLPKLFRVKYFFELFLVSIKSLIQIHFQNKKEFSYRENSFIFICNTYNQFNSLKTIYGYYKQKNQFNTYLYQNIETISFKRLYKLLKFYISTKNDWIKSLESVSRNMLYEFLSLKTVLKEFYNSNFFFLIFNIFNVLYNFNDFIKKKNPLIVFLSDEMKIQNRLIAKYCQNKNIPTIYVPHAAFPIYDEVITKRDYTYLTVPGEIDKKYLVESGENIDKIIVTGRPSYENFFKESIQNLEFVKDMISGRLLKFEPDKFTILFATSPIDFKSKKILLDTVINSIKELNLIENLIIKLHPRENIKWYKYRLEALNVNPIIVKDYDILQLISSSSLLISRVSTTILEALLIGTPIILLDFTNSKFYFSGTYSFTKDNNLLSVKIKKELKDIIHKLVSDKNYYNNYKELLRNLSNKYILYNNEKSSLRIINNLVNQILLDTKKD